MPQSVEVRMKIENFIFRIYISDRVQWKIGVPTDTRYKRRHGLVPNPKLTAGSLAHRWVTQIYGEIGLRQSVIQFLLGNKSVELDQIPERQFANQSLEFAGLFNLAKDVEPELIFVRI